MHGTVRGTDDLRRANLDGSGQELLADTTISDPKRFHRVFPFAISSDLKGFPGLDAAEFISSSGSKDGLR